MERLVTCLPAALLLLILLRPVHDVDLFWQIELGQRGALLEREPFLAGKMDQAHVPIYWLSQIAMAKLKTLGGWRLLVTVDAVLWIGGFLFAVHSAGKASAKAMGLALIAGVLTAVAFQSVRPQSYAVLLFGVLMVLLARSWPVSRKVMLGVPLLLLWQNLHPSVVTAGVFLFVRFVTLVCQWWRGKNTFPVAEWWLGVATAVAMVATPAGWSLITKSANNAEVCTFLRVPEWMPLWAVENRRADAAGAWMGLVAIASILILRRDRVSIETLVPGVVFAVMTLFAFRFALFFGLLLIPLVQAATDNVDEPRFRFGRWAWLGLGAVALISLWKPLAFDRSFPFATFELMKEKNITGPVLTDSAWGSLMPALCPNSHATHDGRMYMRTREEWYDYVLMLRGDIGLPEIVRSFSNHAFLVKPGKADGLIQKLMASEDWEMHQVETSAVLFVRRK